MDWPKPETVTKGVTSITDATSSRSSFRLQSGYTDFTPPRLEIGQTIEYSERAVGLMLDIQQAMVDIANRYDDCVFIGKIWKRWCFWNEHRVEKRWT